MVQPDFQSRRMLLPIRAYIEIYAIFYVYRNWFITIYAFLFICLLRSALSLSHIKWWFTRRTYTPHTLHVKHIDKNTFKTPVAIPKATHKDLTQRLFSTEIQHFHRNTHTVYQIYTKSPSGSVQFCSVPLRHMHSSYIFSSSEITLYFNSEMEWKKPKNEFS